MRLQPILVNSAPVSSPPQSVAERARFIRSQLPPGGLFADMDWRISPAPFVLDADLARELETLGRVLLQFYRAVNLLYRQSVAGKQPAWVADWLDRGKPKELIELQRSPALKNDLPRIIRPDLLLTDTGMSVTELDSVPGGIGLTAWLNQTYAALAGSEFRGSDCELAATDGAEASALSALRSRTTGSGGTQRAATEEGRTPHSAIMGGADGMLRGFASIFGAAPRVHIVVSEESSTYRPEMNWLADRLESSKFQVPSSKFEAFADGDGVYRFFELFDLPNVPNAGTIFQLTEQGRIGLTPPPKPIFEEKMLFALLWNRNLRSFWRRELGESFLNRLLHLAPYTWVVDPAPLPPQAVIPELGLTDWHQLKALSQRERDLILKVSGFSEKAWGARSVYLGSDLSHADWSAAIDAALASFEQTPCVLQRYHKPRIVETSWFDFTRQKLEPMSGRVRLCPYYFVSGQGDGLRATLGGVLATICPADKKIIHGMKDAILVPCATVTSSTP
jgi:hypothetical protein